MPEQRQGPAESDSRLPVLSPILQSQESARIQAAIKEGRYAAAESLARELLAAVETSPHSDSTRIADALDLFVETLWRGGKATEPESRRLAERVVKMREAMQARGEPGLAQSVTNLAWIHFGSGDFAGAKLLFERAVAIREKTVGPDHPDYASSLRDLAVVLAESGDYAGARPLYERALRIREKALGPEHLAVADNLNALAILLSYEGDYGEARRLFERVLAIREKALGPRNMPVAAALSNIAYLLAGTGDYAAARPMYERCLKIFEAIYGPDHVETARTLDDLAVLLTQTGDLESARPLCERALAIRERSVGPSHPDFAASLNTMATLLQRAGDDTAARPLLERALRIREGALGPDHPAVASNLVELAALMAREGQRNAALEAALGAEAIAREHVILTSRTLPERQALSYAATRASGLDLALSVCTVDSEAAFVSQAWDALIRSRALVLDEMAARRRAASEAGDPGLAPLVQAVSSASQRLASLTVHGPGGQLPQRYRELLRESRQEKERAEQALARQSASFRRTQTVARVGLTEVASALAPGDALVAFVRYQQTRLASDLVAAAPAASGRGAPILEKAKPGPIPGYVAFVLGGDQGEPGFVPLGNATEIDSLVSRWRDEVAFRAPSSGRKARLAETRYRGVGAGLRRRVWDPVAAHLMGARRVFVVPDGSLNLLSFASLPVEETDYLVEHGPMIHYLSAERDLATQDASRERGTGLLALGSPNFDATASVPGSSVPASPGASQRGSRSACGDFRSMHFGPLPATAREVEEVTTLWRKQSPGADALEMTGAAASKTALTIRAPGRRILHLATHGFFLGGHCPSVLEVGEGLRGIGGFKSADPPPVVGDNPLLLSGLALAGANRRDVAGPDGDDGILTAEEVAMLDLSGVEWAVLSACETGMGQIKAGEGVLGLRRAFELAGARTVIMSLWPVEDESARRWMRALYQSRLEQKMSTVEAVHAASLAALRERRARGETMHPFYWASFVAVGDWR